MVSELKYFLDSSEFPVGGNGQYEPVAHSVQLRPGSIDYGAEVLECL